jgi:predicted aldo/keto reductase-like oxidoreductase
MVHEVRTAGDSAENCRKDAAFAENYRLWYLGAMNDWLYRTPTALHGKSVFRLGLAANFGIDEDGVRAAMDRGVNLFLWTLRTGGLKSPLRQALKERRESVAVVGYAAIGWFGWGVRSGAEKLLKKLGTDYLDVYQLGWLGVSSAWTSAIERELLHLRDSGKVRALSVSIHDRQRAGQLARSSPLDMLMIRYNAAHPGAEQDIFPSLSAGRPSILAYTATAWRRLLKRPRGWDGGPMTAGDCYRFQLSSPYVDMALMGPANRVQLEENLAALEKGPLSPAEDHWIREFGKAVHG